MQQFEQEIQDLITEREDILFEIELYQTVQICSKTPQYFCCSVGSYDLCYLGRVYPTIV